MLKRQTQKNVFRISALFVAAFLCVFGVFALVKNSFADISDTISIRSAHANFDNRDEGAWVFNKAAKAEDTTQASIEMSLNSILKGTGHAKDLFIMMDSSGSMTNARINAVTSAIYTLGYTLANDDNRMAVDVFNTDVQEIMPFSGDTTMASLYFFDNFHGVGGGTNYYKAIQKIDEHLEGYERDENRDAIAIIITDGAPVEDHPLEVPEYQALKAKYPWLTVQGIQFEMCDAVIPQLADITDNQFVAFEDNIEDKLFEAAMDGEKYSEFVVTDYINDEYYELQDVTVDKGNASITYEGNTPKITWDLSGIYRSGTKLKMNVTLGVKDACINKDDGICATNKRTEIHSKISGKADEDIVTTESPELRFRYDVSYELNAPDGCDTSASTVPATQNYLIGTTVAISSNAPVCSGYQFNGWALVSNKAYRQNDDYFTIPDEDVILRAIWAKPSIEKSMDGSIKEMTTATFRPSSSGNGYYGETNGYITQYRNAVNGELTAIEHIRFTQKQPLDANFNDSVRFSDINSELPIYGYYEAASKTFYFYSDADIIYLNPTSSGMFAQMGKLIDIEGIDHFDASNVTTFRGLFNRDYALTNYEGVSTWRSPNNKSLNQAFFGNSAVTSLHGLEDWDVSSVTDFENAFRANQNLSNITAVAGWDTSSAVSLYGAFSENDSLKNITGLEDWNVKSVTSMAFLFDRSPISSFEPLLGWETDSLNNLSYFSRLNTVATSLHGLENFDTSAVTDLSFAFSEMSKLNDLTALTGWETGAVINMEETFSKDSNLVSLQGLEDWDVGSVERMYRTFFSSAKLENISALSGWRPGSLKTISGGFWRDAKITSTAAFEDWTVGNMTAMDGVFRETGITSLSGLAGWDVRNVENMAYAFAYTKISSLSPLMDWQTLKLKNLSNTFYGCDYVTSLAGLGGWNNNLITTLEGAFGSMDRLDNISALSSWRPTALTNMAETFSGDYSLISIAALTDWRTPSLQSLYGTFSKCTSLASLVPLTDWTTSKVTTIENMLANDRGLTSLQGLESWDMQKLERMGSAFSGVSNVTSLAPLADWQLPLLNYMYMAFAGCGAYNLDDLVDWRLPKMTNFYHAFKNMPNLTSIAGMLNWTPGKVTSFWQTFAGDVNLTSAHGLENIDVSKLTNINEMFDGCTSLSDISALASWTLTGAIINAEETFNGCTALTDVSPLADWNVESMSNVNNMFKNAANITNLTALENWQLPNGTNMSTMFSGIPSSVQRPSWHPDAQAGP